MTRLTSSLQGDITQRLLSPPCEVHWGPWRSNTVQMASAGWEFAVELDRYRDHYNVLMRDRNTGMAGRGRAFVAELAMHSRRFSKVMLNHELLRTDPFIVVEHMQPSEHYRVILPADYVRFDPSPELFTGTIQEVQSKTVDELGIFKKWAPKAGEIIVEPQTVAEMLEKIKRMQSAELAEIRERNRKRELREQRAEQVVAQIITLAA